MKKCPVCKMTSDEENVCPFCQATITYESCVDSNKEKLKLNKYLFLYSLKNSWFSLLCLIGAGVNIAFNSQEFNYIFVLSACLCLLSFFISIFQRAFIKRLKKYYTEKHAIYYIIISKMAIALLSLIISSLLWIS